MDLDTLRLFHEVANALSFAEVARRRGVDPSSVSRSVSQLERQLATRLFERTTRSMRLTESGSLLLERLPTLLDELDQTFEAARGLAGEVRGTLRLGASVALGERLLVPLLPVFAQRHPDLSIDLLLTDRNVDLLQEGVDLAVRLGPRVTRGGTVSRLFRTRYVVAATPAYLAQAPPLHTPGDLENHSCVRLTLPLYHSEWSFRPRTGSDREATATVPISGRVAVSTPIALRTALLQGLGPGLVAEWLVRDELDSGALVDALPDWQGAAVEFDTAAWLVFPERRHLPRKTRAAIELLHEHLGDS